jgi:hypothetical protein
MLGMLKRYEIEVLLKAGHPKMEVAGLGRVSLSSVKRIGEETPVVHVNDAAQRAIRRIGRPSRVEAFRKPVVEILQEKPELPGPAASAGGRLRGGQERAVRSGGILASEGEVLDVQ